MNDQAVVAQREQERTQALAKVKAGERGVMIAAMDDLKEFATVAVNSGTAPKGMNVGSAMMAIQAGLERGLGPLGGLQACVAINGVLSWRGWSAIGLIQQSGLCIPGTFRSWVDGDVEGPRADAVGYCSAHRKGYKEAFVRAFSVADAKKAGLWGKSGPWQSRPTNMLEWRAIGDMARFHFPEVLGGIPIAEEVEAGYGGGVQVEVETPTERAKRPAPKVTDPLLAEVVEGDATGIEDAEEVQAAETDEERQENLEKAAEEEREKEAPPEPEEPQAEEGAKKMDPCPRCGEEDTGYAMFGECGICNYPEPEPGME